VGPLVLLCAPPRHERYFYTSHPRPRSSIVPNDESVRELHDVFLLCIKWRIARDCSSALQSAQMGKGSGARVSTRTLLKSMCLYNE
jgi:hypothetical protein